MPNGVDNAKWCGQCRNGVDNAGMVWTMQASLKNHIYQAKY